MRIKITGFFLAAVLLAAAGFSARAATDEPWVAHRTGLLIPGGFPIFIHSHAPLSSRPLTPKEVLKGAAFAGQVFGQGCQFAISLPTALGINATKVSAVEGNGGYVKALNDIKAHHSEIDGIYDEMVDEHDVDVLGIFQYMCMEITARAFRIPAVPSKANGKG